MIPITRPWLPPLEDYVRLLEGVWSSRMLSNFGALATALEAMTGAYLGVPVALAAASGDIALTLAVRALDLPAGSRVIVPSFTFNSTVNAILWNGHRPVFADIDPTTLTVDPVDVAAHLDGAAAIVATHVFGNPADVDALGALGRSGGVRILYDAAHGYGSRHGRRAIGTFGDGEVFSLSGTKPVTSGEGGLFTTADEDVAERFRYLRGYGFLNDYESRLVGLNGKMSELHAALGLLTMARIETALAVRAVHLDAYRARLGAHPGVTFQAVVAGDRSTTKDIAVLFADRATRDGVEAALTAARVQTKRYFRPCHTMSAYRVHADRPLPATEWVYERILCLPLYEDLAEADRELVIDIVERTLDAPTSIGPRRVASRARPDPVVVLPAWPA